MPDRTTVLDEIAVVTERPTTPVPETTAHFERVAGRITLDREGIGVVGHVLGNDLRLFERLPDDTRWSEVDTTLRRSHRRGIEEATPSTSDLRNADERHEERIAGRVG